MMAKHQSMQRSLVEKEGEAMGLLTQGEIELLLTREVATSLSQNVLDCASPALATAALGEARKAPAPIT